MSQPTATPQATQPTPARTAPPASVDARFQEMLRREKALEQREARLKSLEPQVSRVLEMEARLKQKDISGFLQSANLTYEDIAKTALAGQNPNRGLEDRLARLEEQLHTANQERDSFQKQQAIEEYRQQVARYVDQSSDFPLVKASNAGGAVLDYILDRYHSTGETISEADAARAVESQLSELAGHLISVDSIRQKVVGAGAVQVTTPQVTQDSATLSNSLNDTPSRENWDLVPESESIKRLAAQLEIVE